jgi:nuclear pore complex protein Nup98-Nup96
MFGASTSTPFGASSGFSQPAQSQVVGTAQVKFNPVGGQDTITKNGQSTSINTMHQCITAMKEYEGKSLEELRSEDYQANRKFPATPAATTGFGTGGLFSTGGTTSGFGSTSTSTTSGGLFGSSTASTAAKPLFGSSLSATTTTPASTSLFGGGTQQKSFFCAPTTPTTPTIWNPLPDSETFHYIKYSHDDVNIRVLDLSELFIRGFT